MEEENCTQEKTQTSPSNYKKCKWVEVMQTRANSTNNSSPGDASTTTNIGAPAPCYLRALTLYPGPLIFITALWGSAKPYIGVLCEKVLALENTD